MHSNEKIYVTGHLNPDSDSIASAIGSNAAEAFLQLHAVLVLLIRKQNGCLTALVLMHRYY